MCWELESRRKRTVQIKTAKRDIRVYKILTLDYYSIYYPTCYNEIKTYYARNEESNRIRTIKIGYRKYSNAYGIITYIAEASEGLHSYDFYNAHTRSQYSDYRAVEFVIPKGTKYIYNKDTGEYVSLQLRRIA